MVYPIRRINGSSPLKKGGGAGSNPVDVSELATLTHIITYLHSSAEEQVSTKHRVGSSNLSGGTLSQVLKAGSEALNLMQGGSIPSLGAR